MYAYPDLVVVCGEPQFLDAELDTLVNPVLIVEVLSPTTKNYDRGEKFERYRLIPSFREYLLVAQDRVHVEHFLKQEDGTWVLSETNTIDETVDLSSIGCLLPLSEIYFKVSVPNPSEPIAD
jgi:Uma2 family endonuclease